MVGLQIKCYFKLSNKNCKLDNSNYQSFTLLTYLHVFGDCTEIMTCYKTVIQICCRLQENYFYHL